jgi:hypothetical protein
MDVLETCDGATAGREDEPHSIDSTDRRTDTLVTDKGYIPLIDDPGLAWTPP